MRLRLMPMLLVLTLLALTGPARATPFLLNAGSSGQTLNAHIELLEDLDGRLSITDMADPAVQRRFVPANGRASVGQSRHPWWIRLTLQRTAGAPEDWWLQNAGITVYQAELYLPDGQGGWQRRPTGDGTPFAQGRDYDYRRALFRLPPLGDQPLTLYLRSYDPAGNSFPLSIWQLNDLERQARQENLGYGVIFGVIFALFLYNLFILLALRDRAYFWYVLATGSGLLFILSMTGHGFQYLWPNAAVPFWLDRITWPSLWGVCVMRFTQELLYTRKGLYWPHRIFNAGCALYLLAVAINAIGYRAEAALIIAITPALSVPAALYSAAVRWRQGFIPARFYLIGYGTVLISTVILVMRAAGIIQPSNLTTYLFPVAVGAESILFSFALAYRIQLLMQEKAAALSQVDREKTARMAQLQASTAEVHAAVRRRTAELARANQQLSERERELRHAAFHDPLTELANRRYLIERAEAAMVRARQHTESFGLMLIDLDHFKPINDRHGHDAGDLLLRTLGQRLREQVRSEDLVARLGGDEFAVLIGSANAREHAHDIAARLLDELSRPVLYEGYELTVTVSIGAALFPAHAEQFASLYKAADEALYRAKQTGRSNFVMQGDEPPPEPPAPTMLDVLKMPKGLG